jgi:hypothetical protein
MCGFLQRCHLAVIQVSSVVVREAPRLLIRRTADTARLLHMTLMTLVLLNAALGVFLVWALVRLLAHGIHSDRHHRTARAAELRTLPREHRDRIAA